MSRVSHPPAAPALDIRRLRLSDVPAPERHAAYQAEINDTLETRFLADETTGDIRSCFLGGMHVIHAVAAPRRSERTAAQIARDRQDPLCAQLALAGRSRGQAGAAAVDHPAGAVMLLDFGQPFHMTDEEEREVVNLAVPRRLVTRHLAEPGALHGTVLPVGRTALLVALLTGVARELDRLDARAAQPLADAILDLLLLALGVDPRGVARAPADRRAVLLERAGRLVDGRLAATDLSPEWLGAKLNLSRSDLYALFEPAGGVARFIWRRRLEGARAALADPTERRRIGEIAWAHGFASEAHFSRAFRQAYGASPSATRRAALADDRPAAGRLDSVYARSTNLDSEPTKTA